MRIEVGLPAIASGIVLLLVGCNESPRPPNAAASGTANSSTPADLRNALVGRYDEAQGRVAYSFQYPRYRRHASNKQAGEIGTFEVYDQHPVLDRLGFAGTDAVLLAITPDGQNAPGFITIRPVWSAPGRLQGFQYLALFEADLPEGLRYHFRLGGAPQFAAEPTSRPSQPSKLPDFLPREPGVEEPSMFLPQSKF